MKQKVHPRRLEMKEPQLDSLLPVYLIGIILGIPVLVLILVVNSMGDNWLLLYSTYGFICMLAGFLKPIGRWHWSIAFMIPFFVLIPIGWGYFNRKFLIEATIPVIIFITCGAVGGYLGAWLRSRLKHDT